MVTRTLSLPGVELVHDIHGPLPTADGRPPLLLIAQPMDASGFGALVERFGDRTVITYDPRGLGRSTRSDGRVDNDPVIQAEDLHALITELGGPMEVFASSGGAVTGLALVARHGGDVVTLVAHEPPIDAVLPDAELARRARRRYQTVYQDRGWGAAMADFIGLGSWQGEFTEDYFAQPSPDPAAFGLPTEDDGSRDDPLLSESSQAVVDHQLDVDALRAAGTRIIVAVGEDTGHTYTGRTALGVAAALGQEVVVFPGDHGGFMDGEFGQSGKPDEFAGRLREVLDQG